jgi:hypothetical protein
MRIASSLLFSLLLLAGCITRRDVAADPRYPTDYRIGQIYRLRQPLFLNKDSVFASRPGAHGGVPRSTEDYKNHPASWRNIDALLPVGTRLEIMSIILEKGFESGNFVWVRARILDGQTSGRLIDLTFASRRVHQSSPSASIPQVDPETLELITNAPTGRGTMSMQAAQPHAALNDGFLRRSPADSLKHPQRAVWCIRLTGCK